MAVLHPEYDTIIKLRQEPTEGELHLLRFLKSTLNDDYEVFFQPFINGDMPDIIIMKEGSGVYVIEVKDWDLKHYSLNDRNRWFVNSIDGGSYPVPSPVQQVYKYKENLYNLHVRGLLEKRIKKHARGQGSRYTRSRLPIRLVYSEKMNGRNEALKREHSIKKLSRSDKNKLVNKNTAGHSCGILK